MKKDEIIRYWIESSDEDFEVMIDLFNLKKYSYSLFFGHLVIEKLLKAHYVKNVEINVPKIHDLLKLADKSKIELTEEQKLILKNFNTFNIKAKYDDFKKKFYEKCNKKFTNENIEKITEIRKWLRANII
ncbi:MAG: HEPN domain-containing protein [bacterium]